MSDPFAEIGRPWWERPQARKTRYAPKRLAMMAAVFGGLVNFALSGRHELATSILVSAVAVAPAAVIEAWYKHRHRRQAERLFVLPEYQPIGVEVSRVGKA